MAYSLRGKNLYIVLGVIIAIAILVVFGKMNACMHACFIIDYSLYFIVYCTYIVLYKVSNN
jgi:hypothetical protein